MATSITETTVSVEVIQIGPCRITCDPIGTVTFLHADMRPVAFYGMPKARAVYAMLREAAKALQKDVTSKNEQN